MFKKLFDKLDNFLDQLFCEHDWELEYVEFLRDDGNKYHYICLDCGKKLVLHYKL